MTDILAIVEKDPDAVVDRTINWASADGTNDGGSTDTGWLQGDTISTSTWIVDTGITQDSDSSTTKLATIWLSGGTDGISYEVTNRITTAAGRTEDRTLLFTILER